MRHDSRFAGKNAVPDEREFANIAYSKIGVIKLASHDELSRFLAESERRAYKQALFAVRDEQAALDIVQDAMIRLSEKYGGNPEHELPMLFQRILQNAIRDYYRRHKVRSSWLTSLFSVFQQRDEEEQDSLDWLQDPDNHSQPPAPERELEQAQMIALIEEALMNLSPRQREAFLLRYWEDMDTEETAAAMGCSEGSVKAHCSRATQALAVALRAKGVKLP